MFADFVSGNPSPLSPEPDEPGPRRSVKAPKVHIKAKQSTSSAMAQMQEEEWRNGLCSHVCGGSFEVCMASFCCNCFMYGRLDRRLEQFPKTDKDSLSMVNAACGIMCIANYVHLFWIPVWMKRQEMRRAFNIKGNGCTDCLTSYFCHCCAIAQMETEVKDRAASAQMQNGGGKEAQYASQAQGMSYQQPA